MIALAAAGCWTQAVPPPRPEPAHELVPPTCQAFRHASQGTIARLLARFPADEADPPHTLVGFCATTPRGLWRIELPVHAADVAEDRESAITAIETRYEIVHVTQSSQRAAYAPAQRLSGYGRRMPQRPIVFDFDRDGEPELFVAVDELGPEGHQQHEVMLVHWDGTRVVPYEPAAAYEVLEASDVDGDGRPDLHVLAGYDDPLSGCQSSFPYDWPEAMFVAHSLDDGTFSTEDAVARKHARRWCPGPPRAITSSRDAVCARLWATTAAAIMVARAQVAASCVGGYCDRELAGKPQPPNASEDCERRQAWFERPPPLALP
jgi:hypothetical protein